MSPLYISIFLLKFSKLLPPLFLSYFSVFLEVFPPFFSLPSPLLLLSPSFKFSYAFIYLFFLEHQTFCKILSQISRGKKVNLQEQTEKEKERERKREEEIKRREEEMRTKMKEGLDKKKEKLQKLCEKSHKKRVSRFVFSFIFIY